MFALAPSASAAGYRLEAHESVGSTNALALEGAVRGDPGKLWIVSKNQTSGRGRRGRVWATPPGNLAATLLLAEKIEPGMAATLGFVAGLSLADALRRVAPNARLGIGIDGVENQRNRSRFELKWPNDLLADGAKLAGILLESAMLDQGRFAVAVGIGVNIVSYPDDTPYPSTSLHALGVDCDAEQVFAALSAAWVHNFALWQGPNGMLAIRDRWLRQAAGLGSSVSIRADGRVVRGTFETIDDQCRFVVREDDGSRVLIAAGDVHFGAVASVKE